MDPGNQNFCLKWNNHKTNMIDVFEELRQNENFTDLTFVLDTGEKLKCHQIVLAACSGFIQENCHMIAPIDQFIIILSKETRFKDLVALITYIYRGEVNVTAEDLPEFLKLAESLQVIKKYFKNIFLNLEIVVFFVIYKSCLRRIREKHYIYITLDNFLNNSFIFID